MATHEKEFDSLLEVECEERRYATVLAATAAKVVADKEASERVRELRLGAIPLLHAQLRKYEKRNYMDVLIDRIAEKKCDLILSATSKEEIEKILKPRCPHYNGNEFLPDAYCVPEEELICWCETSLSSPLNSVGFERYMKVFGEVFPEQVCAITGRLS